MLLTVPPPSGYNAYTTGGRMRCSPNASLKERLFRNSVDADNGCRYWVGRLDKHGYGQIKVKGKSMFAHRVSYAEYVAPIPEGMCILHTCDNRECIRPSHLVAGTSEDNARDMAEKGRGTVGSSNYFAKLTNAQAIHIYQSKDSSLLLSVMYDIAESTVDGIRSGRRWRHITGAPTRKL